MVVLVVVRGWVGGCGWFVVVCGGYEVVMAREMVGREGREREREREREMSARKMGERCFFVNFTLDFLLS